MTTSVTRIGLVAGEASGDILGAGLIQALKKRLPEAEFVGIAGPQMQQQGCRTLFDMEELSVMGLIEVLSRIRRLLAVRRSLVEHFTVNPPDVFVGIDAPDFNLGLEEKLKQQGIPTVHYVSPTVWAWREKRIVKIARATNMVLSLLPFEKIFYDRHQVPCTFVGHTLADAIPLKPDQRAARHELGLDDNDKVLAVLPGSRGGEVQRLLPPFLQTVSLLQQKIPGLKVLIPAANDRRREQILAGLEDCSAKPDVRVLDGQSRQVMIAADAVLLASGTASLEAMLCKKPMLVAYKFNWLTYQMGKRMYKPEWFSLPNLLANEELVPELVQHQVVPQTMAEKLQPMLENGSPELICRFEQLHQQLKIGADERAAEAIIRLLNANEHAAI
ncbi:lipid-A-disaccharide synthase [Lacimicrobium alkaliphilum]|uniref:Lipid-A-disaccharide synthase n=1 Tax=Lacimicrobium alkaliphilum TaxID=1526571 RepID=A0A0U2ZH77_9ALTE|nr:lipid-A-disaccharide synthase [Lacimicrobium alkaliphilum]ALS97772.1 lipid-A-disaccharide synthase [Lacimicrobium alkaliphilum]